MHRLLMILIHHSSPSAITMTTQFEIRYHILHRLQYKFFCCCHYEDFRVASRDITLIISYTSWNNIIDCSNLYFRYYLLLMYIHLMMYIVHQGSVLSYENGFNPLNGDSPEWMDIPLKWMPPLRLPVQ